MIFNTNVFVRIILPGMVLCLLLYIFLNSIHMTKFMIILKKYTKIDRVLFLVIISFGFYAWASLKCFILLLLLSLVNYGIVCFMEMYEKNRKKFLLILLSLDILLLLWFKYSDFSLSIINYFLTLNIKQLNFIMPLGISFYTFSMISFVMDIYRNKAEKCSFKIYLLYIFFFPKIVSGPIVLYRDFVSPFLKLEMTNVNISKGLQRFSLGMAKKVILADTIGITVNEVFSNIGSGVDMPTAWLVSICYSLQIYLDFSGYSDMAIGLAEICGYKFNENFDFTYISKSITEFWRRWHISLGTWFREYLYFSLGGNRNGHTYRNLFIVFLITGIWHGANWTFIIWGIYYGILIVFEKWFMNKTIYKKIPDFIKWAITLFLINIGWVIFKSNNLTEAIIFFKTMFGQINYEFLNYEIGYYLNIKLICFILISFSGSFIFCSKKFQKLWFDLMDKNKVLYAIKTSIYLLLFVLSLIYMTNATFSPNIYFQF